MHNYSDSDFSQAAAHDEILRLEEVIRRTALSKTSIYGLIRAGRFPRQRRLAGPGSRSVGWSAKAINRYIDVILSGGEYIAGRE